MNTPADDRIDALLRNDARQWHEQEPAIPETWLRPNLQRPPVATKGAVPRQRRSATARWAVPLALAAAVTVGTVAVSTGILSPSTLHGDAGPAAPTISDSASYSLASSAPMSAPDSATGSAPASSPAVSVLPDEAGSSQSETKPTPSETAPVVFYDSAGHRGGDSALLSGKLVVTNGCLSVETSKGQTYALVVPTKYRWTGYGLTDGTTSLDLNSDVEVGGGERSSSPASEQIPPGCSADMWWTVADHP